MIKSLQTKKFHRQIVCIFFNHFDSNNISEVGTLKREKSCVS